MMKVFEIKELIECHFERSTRMPIQVHTIVVCVVHFNFNGQIWLLIASQGYLRLK